MNKNTGQFKKGEHRSPATEFKPGMHWRKDQPFHHKKWLEHEYIEQRRSAGDIARQYGVTDAAIIFWLNKHGIPRRTTAEVRAYKYWGVSGSDNPMWNKRGELNPRWLGGVTPQRQAFYTSQEWKKACKVVWKRDNATCQRCNLHRQEQMDMPFHIHHIISFAVEELRAEPSNLVLLCETCHQFIHSRRNINGDFISQK
jgi:5-methylcytosine-specific restriction endonuclease McrA